MDKYHKIQTVFKRDPATKHKTLLEGDFTYPEFRFLRFNHWVFTEKVDGTNIRIMFDPEARSVTFGGRGNNSQIPAKLTNALNEMFSARVNLFEDFDAPMCLYGEGYGAGIQKVGANYSPINRFALFDVKIGDVWLERHNVQDIADRLEIEDVPIIGTGTLDDMVEIARRGFKSTWGDFQAEGIVARPLVEMRRRTGERIITKIKCRDFPS